MSKKSIPVYTPGAPGCPSIRVPASELKGIPTYSTYNGKKLSGLPTMGTPIGSKRGHYHGGLLLEKDGKPVIMVHGYLPK